MGVCTHSLFFSRSIKSWFLWHAGNWNTVLDLISALEIILLLELPCLVIHQSSDMAVVSLVGIVEQTGKNVLWQCIF